MEHTYRLEDTLENLQRILQSQFEMQADAAKFFVCLLVKDQKQNAEEEDLQTELWYLEKHDRYTTPIFESRFSISFTELKKNMAELLFQQFGTLIDDKEMINFSTILNCFLAVYRSGTIIQKRECCVYYQALNWKKMHASQEYFCVEEILPKNGENVCEHLDYIRDKKWECNLCSKENCHANLENFSIILDGLCERNVFKKYNSMYRFVI